jgi:hypothetical protein
MAMLRHHRLSALALLALEYDVTPAPADCFFADALVKDFHPTFFVFSAVGVEVDDLAVRETDSEAFFDKHVALFFLCKARLAPAAALTSGFFLR